jgi:hypothetical protein
MRTDYAKNLLIRLHVGQNCTASEGRELIRDLLDTRRVLKATRKLVFILLGIAFVLLILFVFTLIYARSLGARLGE